MKYLKTFEQNSNEPEIGDYVVLGFDDSETAKASLIINKLLERIGKIVGSDSPNHFLVHFGTTNFRIEKRNIAYFSKNKEDLQIVIDARKYNL